MTYSRNELLSIQDLPSAKFQEITQTLLNKLVNKEDLSFAESKFVCLKLRSIYSDDPNFIKLKAEDFNQCADFIFWQKYVLYWHDHEGWGEIKDGLGVIPPDQKRLDAQLLQQHYEQWKTIVVDGKYTTAILQTVANETIRLIKEVVAYSKSIGEGSNRQKYIEKALILHSKFLYYQVTEYYGENNQPEEFFDLCNNLVVIDSFVYIHTLFGHFAAEVKFNRPGKTYHKNGNVDFRSIPKEILYILQQYSQHVDCKHFNKQAIFFKLNGADYAIWFRSMTRSVKGGQLEEYLRVQTYYPVELPDDRNKIANMTPMKASDNLIFYV